MRDCGNYGISYFIIFESKGQKKRNEKELKFVQNILSDFYKSMGWLL
uniref:Uncharacterized protein n=1 Tax=Onchocerca volvulus TaxID=6282 RepID=A0A8R1TW62_ONCVO